MNTISPGVVQRVRTAREAFHNIYAITPRLYRDATYTAMEAIRKADHDVAEWNTRTQSLAKRLSARYPKFKKPKALEPFAERVARAAKALEGTARDARAGEAPGWIWYAIEDAETAVKKLQHRMNR